jgi:outer membrane protein OmpA-like peptidoglycan-associated protein
MTAVLLDLCTRRAATLGLLSLLSGACPVLVATSDLAAQSSIPAHQPVRQIPDFPQAGAPAAPTQGGRAGTPVLSPLTELNKAVAAAQAMLEELSRAAEAVASARQLSQELQLVYEQNQLLTSDLASAEREHAEAKVTIERLRSRLAAAEQRVSALKATNASLNTELQALYTAANNAADVARQNLRAITRQVETLNAVMSGAAQGAAGLEAPTPKSSEPGQGKPDGTPAILAVARPHQDLGAKDEGPALTTAKARDPSSEQQAVGKPPLPGGLGSDLADAMAAKEKLQVEALLADLKPVSERSGLLVTVPGSALFRANSNKIEQTSYPTLAKVAELINIYPAHRVLIVGHTDAYGEPAYNQVLSKRRAETVKQFLVDNFDISAARLATEGKGEDAPIASNGTLAGREVNRRVEVLLLN